MRKIVLILLMLPWCCGAEGLVGEVVSPVWSHLQIIFEYGGMPAVILLFGWMYLRSVNSKWSSLIEKMQSQFMQQQHIMQEQFIQQQQMLLVVVQNNTAMLSTLSTKLGMGCMVFQHTAEQIMADREAQWRVVESGANSEKSVQGFETGETDGKKD